MSHRNTLRSTSCNFSQEKFACFSFL